MRRRLLLVLFLPLVAACRPEAEQVEAADAASAARPAPAAAAATPAPAARPDTTGGDYYEILTPRGRMVIRVYDETPIHRDNFRKLVAETFFDSTTFHRVIGGFMIQGGDPNSKDDDPADDGEGGPGYTLEAEFNPAFFHKRGALAAARQGDAVNPEQRSSGSQFYIVHGGRPIPAEVLTQMQAQLREDRRDPGFTFSQEAIAAYTTVGGAPHLDGAYTIFGELVEGFDVLDAIAAVPTARSTGRQVPPPLIDRPFEPIPMTLRSLPDYGK